MLALIYMKYENHNRLILLISIPRVTIHREVLETEL